MANNFVKSFFKVTSISIITRLVSFIFHIYLSRIFGALNIGIYSIASSVFVMFACFAASGFPVTLSRKIAHYDALGDYDHSNSILTSTLLITAGISTLLCLFFNLFPSSLNLLFSNPKCREVFRILSPTLISTAIYATFRSWFWGKKKYTTYSLLEFADEAFLLVGVLIIWLTKFYSNEPYNAFALANVLGDVFCMIVIVLMFIVFGGKMKKPKYAQEITTSSLPITTTRIISSLMSSVIALLLPSLLVHSGLSMDMATADYGRMSSMVLPIALAPNTIIGSLLVIMIPEISSQVAKQGKRAANGKIGYSMVFTAIISALLMTIFISCGEDISVMFYADEKAGKMLVVTAMIIIHLVINQLTVSLLNTLGKEKSTFWTSIISSVGLIITLVIFAKPIGIYAYPAALLVYHTIGLCINTFKLKKCTEVSTKYLIVCGITLLLSVGVGYLVKMIGLSYANFNIFARICISTTIASILFATFALPTFLHYKKQNKITSKDNK